jgi:hypothetical protein
MQTNSLTRWAGAALALSGLFFAFDALHPDSADPNALASPLWIPVHVILGLGMLLYLPGITGLYSQQAPRLGRLGFIGFVLSFFGIAVFAGTILTAEAFLFPLLGTIPATAALMADPNSPLNAGPLAFILIAASVAFALGCILLGIALLRWGNLPRIPVVLMVIGGVFIPFAPPLPQFVAAISAILLGVAMVWLGYRVWAGASASQPAPAMAMPQHA